MNKKILILILFPIILYAQDPSFSQIDLNSMYINPAFASYEGNTKIMLHSRNQWSNINENFNNTLFEFSSRVDLNKNNKKLQTAWCYGTGLLTEDLVIFPELGNSVFIEKQELYIMPFTMEMKITKNSYLSAAPINITFRKYELKYENLVFSDMIDDFGNIYSLQSSSFNPDLYIHNNLVSDISSGIIYTRHGKYRSTKSNRFNIGISLHHLLNPIESFSGNNDEQAKLPNKITLHSELYSSIPKNKKPVIPYFRILFKHETYAKQQEIIMNKTEFGSTIFFNRTNIEFGNLFRIIKNESTSPFFQNWIPIIRYRINNSNHLYILSYSYDGNISKSNKNLQFTQTGHTHEIGISIYLSSGNKRNRTCAGFEDMSNNPLYQDIMKNGLLNKRK